MQAHIPPIRLPDYEVKARDAAPVGVERAFDELRCEGHDARTDDSISVFVPSYVCFPSAPFGSKICLHTSCDFCPCSGEEVRPATGLVVGSLSVRLAALPERWQIFHT